jgi:hypothetical protein
MVDVVVLRLLRRVLSADALRFTNAHLEHRAYIDGGQSTYGNRIHTIKHRKEEPPKKSSPERRRNLSPHIYP